jgi:hypothetical protein
MADTFTTLLRLIKQETGGNENVWGDFLNDQMIDLVDDAIAGFQDVDVTLSNQVLLPLNGDDDPTRAAILVASGLPPDGTRTIQVPSTSKLYVLSNETSEIVTFKTAAGSGLAVAPGDTVSSRVDPNLDDVVAVSVPSATEDIKGIAEIATQAEVDAGTDDERIITPAKLAAFPAVNQATETVAGVAEIADSTEANEDTPATDDLRIITPLKLDGRTATETRRGVIELATQTEVDDGVDTERAVTPATLAAKAGGAFSGCVLTRDAFWTSGHTSPTFDCADEEPIPFTQETLDTGAADFGTQFHDTGVNPERITIPAGVTLVRLIGSVSWDQFNQNGTGMWHMRIRKNGSVTASIDSGMANYIPHLTADFFGGFAGTPDCNISGQIITVPVAVVEDDFFELTTMTQGTDFGNLRIEAGTAAFSLVVLS